MRVRLESLTKVFSNKKTKKNVKAVDNLTLDIPDGKLIGLLGPSGCGKSTTLYMISGLERQTEGKIFFDDKDVSNLSPEKRGIGLVFQNYALYPHMTVLQNIMFPLLNSKWKKEDALKRAHEVASLVQIDELMDRKPAELSGGQQQRVAIARSLAKKPNVLLLDEPLSNLDARLRIQTREEIKRIQVETKVTTIFVTHDQEEAMSISDFIVLMKKGVVQQVGKPQEIYENPCNLFVAKFLGIPPINVFNGYIKNKELYIGLEKIKKVNLDDQQVYIGIRPEGFIVDNINGYFTTTLENIEVMGRDVSIISKNIESVDGKPIRSIVSNDKIKDIDKEVKFRLVSEKILIFNKETEERIYE